MGLIQQIQLLLDPGSKAKFESDMREAGQTGGQGLAGAVQAGAEGAIKEFLAGIAKGIIAAFSIEKIVEFGKAAVDAFARSSLAAGDLTFTMQKLGATSADVEAALTRANALGIQGSVFGGSAAVDALQRVIAITQNYQLSVAALPAVLDLAAARHLPLEEAATLVGKALEGNSTMLRRLIPDLRDGVGVIQQLTDHFGGAAAAQLDTFGGKLKQLGSYWDDMKEAMGEAMVEAGSGTSIMDTLSGSVQGLTKWLRENRGAIREWGVDFAAFVADQVKKAATDWDTLNILGGRTAQMWTALALSVKDNQASMAEFLKLDSAGRLRDEADQLKAARDGWKAYADQVSAARTARWSSVPSGFGAAGGALLGGFGKPGAGAPALPMGTGPGPAYTGPDAPAIIPADLAAQLALLKQVRDETEKITDATSALAQQYTDLTARLSGLPSQQLGAAAQQFATDLAKQLRDIDDQIQDIGNQEKTLNEQVASHTITPEIAGPAIAAFDKQRAALGALKTATEAAGLAMQKLLTTEQQIQAQIDPINIAFEQLGRDSATAFGSPASLAALDQGYGKLLERTQQLLKDDKLTKDQRDGLLKTENDIIVARNAAGLQLQADLVTQATVAESLKQRLITETLTTQQRQLIVWLIQAEQAGDTELIRILTQELAILDAQVVTRNALIAHDLQIVGLVKQGATAMIQFAQAAGLLDANTAAALKNIVAIGDSVATVIGGIAQGGFAGIQGIVTGAVGILGALGDLIGGMSAEQKAHNAALERNTQALKDLTAVQAAVAANISGKQFSGVQQALTAAFAPVTTTSTVGGSPATPWSPAVPGRTTTSTRAPYPLEVMQQFNAAMTAAGITWADVQNVAKQLGITVGDSVWSTGADILLQLSQAMSTGSSTLAGGVGATFAQKYQNLQTQFVGSGASQAQQLTQVTALLGAAAPILFGGDITKLSTDDLKKRVQALITQYTTSGVPRSSLGSLTEDQYLSALNDLMTRIQAVADEAARQQAAAATGAPVPAVTAVTAAGGTVGYSVQRTFTVAQGDVVGGELRTLNLHAERMEAYLATIAARAISGFRDLIVTVGAPAGTTDPTAWGTAVGLAIDAELGARFQNQGILAGNPTLG